MTLDPAALSDYGREPDTRSPSGPAALISPGLDLGRHLHDHEEAESPNIWPKEYNSDADVSATAFAENDTPFRQLVHDHRKRLYRFILKNIGNSSDAEDLVQQAFLEAARSYCTYRGESALSTWLYGIAMNLTRNYLSRSPHRKYDFADEESLNGLTSREADPSDALSDRQTVNALQRELAALPGEMREVLLLVALDEVSYEEAAVMLAIPVGTVRSRVSRARERLRGRLRDTGITLDF